MLFTLSHPSLSGLHPLFIFLLTVSRANAALTRISYQNDAPRHPERFAPPPFPGACSGSLPGEPEVAACAFARCSWASGFALLFRSLTD